MNEMIKEWSKFVGGMSSQFLDLKNKIGNNPDYLKSSSGLHLSLSRENKISKSFV
jgi:hypothetical protein